MGEASVLIVGAGLMGATSAYYLAEAGWRVTVVDKGQVGHGCSYGNAGWIVPAHAMPLAAPGVVWQGLKWMLNPESPLYIKPRASAAMIRWLWRFSRSANAKDFQNGAKALMSLAHQTLELYKRFNQEHPETPFSLRQRGLLQACRTQAALEEIRHEAELGGQVGMRHEMMTGAELRKFEPAIRCDVVGGVYLPDEADAEPLATVRAFAEGARRKGATFMEGAEVYEWIGNARRIEGVRTTGGVLRADQYILAAGSWSPRWQKMLGLKLPIQAGKGYAVIVDPIDPMPRGPISLTESKVAVTPRDGSLRLSGTMELAGLDESISARRVEAILRTSRECLNVPAEPKVREVWRGLRPCTPDGLPIIGRAGRWENLTVAAGHAMLGLTLAAGTGRLVADLLCGSGPVVDPRAFSPDRF